MTPKLKVCGMRDPENIKEAASLQPDYMGFIFYEKSKRFVGRNFSIPVDFPVSIRRVGVFVNEKIDTILETVSNHKLHYVQLHGDETPEYCKTLIEREASVIKVFSIDESFEFDSTKPYEKYADFFLFDTKSENRGGSGKVFDWSILNRYNQQIPFFLSGGLGPENIAKVKTLTGMNLYAVDVNSGVEASPGVKDILKVKSVITMLSNF